MLRGLRIMCSTRFTTGERYKVWEMLSLWPNQNTRLNLKCSFSNLNIAQTMLDSILATTQEAPLHSQTHIYITQLQRDSLG